MTIQDSIRLLEASHKTAADNVNTLIIGVIILAAITLVGYGMGWIITLDD